MNETNTSRNATIRFKNSIESLEKRGARAGRTVRYIGILLALITLGIFTIVYNSYRHSIEQQLELSPIRPLPGEPLFQIREKKTLESTLDARGIDLVLSLIHISEPTRPY